MQVYSSEGSTCQVQFNIQMYTDFLIDDTVEISAHNLEASTHTHRPTTTLAPRRRQQSEVSSHDAEMA